MILLAIYWNPSLFWWVYLPFIILCAYWMWRAMSSGMDNGWDVVAFIALVLMAILGAISCFVAGDQWRTDAVLKEINQTTTLDEERYYHVTLVGKKSVVYNPTDNMRYVRMGDGRMINLQVITSNKMCRACVQFNDTAYVDSVYVYSAATSDREWFNEPELYFSEHPDLVFEEMMDRPVK